MRPSALFAIALIAVSLSAAPQSAQSRSAIDTKIEQQRAKLNDVQYQLKRKRAELDGAAAKVGSIQGELAVTNQNIASVQVRLDQLTAGIHTTERNLAWNRVQLTAAQKTLQLHNDALRRRLIDAYEYGDLGYLAVLLEAKSFGDFVERWNDVRYVIKANEATIRQRKADADHIDGIRRSLLGQEASLRQAQASADQQRRALDGLAAQRRNLLAAAENDRTQAQSQVSQLADVSEAAEAALEALVAEKQREEEARRAAARRAAQLAGQSVGPEEGAPGALQWPVSGPITSPFGMRMHPVYGRPILHAGIDIAAAQGTTIGAAGEGRIIVAGYQGDCGNMVAIDHHGGLSTVYCHMSQIFVGVGQDVQRGQAIGAVGMTGDATGPHLHFGVLQNGRPVDPMSFLR